MRQVLAFSHIPKTAGITLNRILRREFGIRHCDAEPWHDRNGEYFSGADFEWLHWLYPGVQSIAGHQVKPYSDLISTHWANVLYYTFLREPLARTASHYQYHVQQKGSTVPFEKWIKKDIQRDVQVKYLAGIADLDTALDILNTRVFFIGLLERFDDSLVMFRRRIEAFYRVSMFYQRENVAHDGSIKQRLLTNMHTKELLVDANQLDLELYAHVCEKVWPAQVSAYGDRLERDVAEFRAANVVKSRSIKLYTNLLKRHTIYKPLLFLYRRYFI